MKILGLSKRKDQVYEKIFRPFVDDHDGLYRLLRFPAVDSSGLESLSQSTSSSLESMEESPADSSEISQEDIPVVAPWQDDLPENHQMDPAVFAQLHADLESSDVYAMVTVKDGVIIDEYYQEGYDETSVFPLHSCTKSFTSALVGIAIEQGYLPAWTIRFPTICHRCSIWQTRANNKSLCAIC